MNCNYKHYAVLFSLKVAMGHVPCTLMRPSVRSLRTAFT